MGLGGDIRVAALRADRAGDALADLQRHGDAQGAVAGVGRRAARAQSRADHCVPERRPAPGDPSRLQVIDGERVVARGQLDRVAAIPAEIDRARTGDRVALKPQKRIVSVHTRQYHREREREQDDRRGGDAGDREYEPPSHDSNR